MILRRFYLHRTRLLFVLEKRVFVIFCPFSIYSLRRLCADFCPRGCLFTILSPIKKPQRTHEYQKQLHTFTYKLRYVYQTVNINVQTWFPCGRSVFFCESVPSCLSLFPPFIWAAIDNQTGSFESKSFCFECLFLYFKGGDIQFFSPMSPIQTNRLLPSTSIMLKLSLRDFQPP